MAINVHGGASMKVFSDPKNNLCQFIWCRKLKIQLYAWLFSFTHFSIVFLFCLFYRMGVMKHIKDFFQVIFKVDEQKKEDEEEELKLGGEKLILTCVGIGYSNVSKAIL